MSPTDRDQIQPQETTPDHAETGAAATESTGDTLELAAHAPGRVQVIRRNGKVTHFDANKIMVAMTKAFLAVEGGSAAASSRIHDRVRELTEQVVSALTRRLPGGGTVHIEDIPDQVELALMRAGEHKVARDYVLYRWTSSACAAWWTRPAGISTGWIRRPSSPTPPATSSTGSKRPTWARPW